MDRLNRVIHWGALGLLAFTLVLYLHSLQAGSWIHAALNLFNACINLGTLYMNALTLANLRRAHLLRSGYFLNDLWRTDEQKRD